MWSIAQRLAATKSITKKIMIIFIISRELIAFLMNFRNFCYFFILIHVEKQFYFLFFIF